MTIRPRAYTPAREAADVLVRRTVGRDDVLARILRTLTAAARSGSRSHVLLVGPRGHGKSHVIRVAMNRMRDTHPPDAEKLVFALVPEDAVGFTRLDDLLDLALQSLGADRPPRTRSGAERQQQVSELLDGRVLVLVVENLDRVMADLGPGDQRAFRSWVESTGEVLVLATTPLLFSGVKDRDEPWFNAFDVIRLRDLTADEGHELLVHLATQDDDQDLVDFLATPRGHARVQALAELTGGSPRIWTILRDCLTPQSLDELVPAVQDLLDGLTPYYQGLLWDLPAQEKRIVRALAEADSATMTVAEIAEAAGVPTGVSTLLRRLETSKWVERVETDTPDRRKSWYRLREPLLRHHFQYRSGDGQPVTLVVTILKIAFEPEARRKHLLSVELESPAFVHLSETFRDEPRRSDAAYVDRDVDALHAEALLWLGETGPWTRATSGRIVSNLVAASREADEFPMADAVGRRLQLAVETADDTRSAAHLGLMATCWDDSLSADSKLLALQELLPHLDPSDPLRLLVSEEIAFWTGEAGDPAAARDHLHDLVVEYASVLGAGHPDTLRARSIYATQTGRTGDHFAARDLFAALMRDHVDALGPDHIETLVTRSHHAHHTGEAGDHVTARDLYAGVIHDRTRVMGPDHPHTLIARHNHAVETARAGQAATALDLCNVLVADFARILGPDHHNTIRARGHHATLVADCGDARRARDLYASLVTDSARVLGPDHSETRGARWAWANSMVSNDLPIAVRLALVSGDTSDEVPDQATRPILMQAVLAGAMTRGVPTGVAAIDLMIDAKRGSQEALTRLPTELRNVLDLLPDPPEVTSV